MADISTLMGISVDNLSKYCGVDSDTINTIMGLTWPHGPQSIGEYWQGGYYFGDLNGYYLIAAETEVGGYQWKTSLTTTVGADSYTDGYANQVDMVAAGISDHIACQYCYNLSSGGYTDWYMPAIDELAFLYASKAALVSAGLSFLDETYWSSTENSDMAYVIAFSDGTQLSKYKTSTTPYTRAIRRVLI